MFELLPVAFVATLFFGLWELKAERWRFALLMSVFALAMGVFLVSLQPAVWVFSSPWVAFACWEVMGFCSYQLIAHKEKESSQVSKNALRAFLLTKIGDLGFLAAILVGFNHPAAFSLLAFAALAKSAQWPLHSWLVGAMVGPSAASALIHSATMVAAGVVLLSQAGQPPTWFLYLTAFSSVWAALWSTQQQDLKKILAYSTIAQLGVMYFTLPQSEPYLLAHGYYKAPLFLLAGIVIKKSRLGTIGFVALALTVFAQLGLPFFKMSEAKHMVWGAVSNDKILQSTLLLVFFLNAFAMGRFVKLALKESFEKTWQWIEVLPLVVVLGGLSFEFHFSAGLSFFVGLVGFVAGSYFYRADSKVWGDPMTTIWDFAGAAVLKIPRVILPIETKVFDVGFDKLAMSTKLLARGAQLFDEVFINNVLVRGVLAFGVNAGAFVARSLQVGRSQAYLVFMIIAFLILLYGIGVNR